VKWLQLPVTNREPLSTNEVPALAQLSALQSLGVNSPLSPIYHSSDLLKIDGRGSIEVASLLSMQHVDQLKVLRLEGNLSPDTMDSLLGAMPRLANLGSLAVTSFDVDEEYMPHCVGDVSRYSALLSSAAHMKILSITSRQACMLPAGCGAHMFPEGCQLLQLERLLLGPFCCALHGVCVEGNPMYYACEDHGGIKVPEACFGPGDVDRLVRCCPAFEELWMPGLVEPGVDVSALLRLTAVTGLYIGGEVYDDDVAVSVLAEMGSLRELAVCDAPQLTDQGLLALTALTNLRQLCVLCCGLSNAMPTYLNGRRTTEDDELEGYFMISKSWREVRHGAGYVSQLLCFQDTVVWQWLHALSAQVHLLLAGSLTSATGHALMCLLGHRCLVCCLLYTNTAFYCSVKRSSCALHCAAICLQDDLPAVWLQLLQLLTASAVCGEQAQKQLTAMQPGEVQTGSCVDQA
jgi:hypothetical protein